MQVISINTAKAQALQVGKKSVVTGIFKQPKDGEIYLGPLGLEGDTIVNKKFHGGEDQAVYLYSAADYAWWANELGRELAPGAFGENLTITDFHDATLRIGDRLFIGDDIELEITAPRVPCAQFAAKMGDGNFGKLFVAAEKPGAYARVIRRGTIRTGDAIVWQPTDKDYASINEVFVEWHQKTWSEHVARKALNSPISKIARRIIQERSGVDF